MADRINKTPTGKEIFRRLSPQLYAGLRVIWLGFHRYYGDIKKRSLAKQAKSRHIEFLGICRQKKQLKVLFIGLHRSAWKTDEVFRAMQADPAFDPSIFVAPTLNRDEVWAENERLEAQIFFQDRAYETHSTTPADGAKAAVEKIAAIKPDLVFFTNHHTLTFPELYKYILENYLTCYVPYSASVSKFDDYQTQYNKDFHNQVWKIFAPHYSSAKNFKSVQAISGRNVTITGYPAFEPLVMSDSVSDPWKSPRLMRVIWAPHHTIDMPRLPYANFLRHANFMRKLVEDYKGRIQWCFKPHPLLKPKLMRQPDWGPGRTEEYFKFWESNSNTQMELGGYDWLFRGSDAMIHDSGSFLAEYLYVDKPVMYLWSSPKVVNYFNEFGLEALGSCERGDTEDDIRKFIESILRNEDSKKAARSQFLRKFPVMMDGKLPSARIIEELKSSIWPKS
ncbi:MAG: CDP-glycerol glycerophosphotransferase family protein [Rhodobacterales bacterium]